MNQIGRQGGQPLVSIVAEAIFDRDVLALDKARVFQSLAERGEKLRCIVGRAGVEESDNRHRRLLRARRERPRGCRATEQRDELAPVHSITSSARSTSPAGTS